METNGKHTSLYYNGISPADRTHKARVEINMERIKHLVCKTCELTPKAYDEAHYDLAESWFIYNDYLEHTAKVFMLSPTYHRWWNQQITFVEDEFLRKWGNQQIPAMKMREAMFEEIITMEIHPSAELRREMHREGTEILRLNPELSRLKIYRNG